MNNVEVIEYGTSNFELASNTNNNNSNTTNNIVCGEEMNDPLFDVSFFPFVGWNHGWDGAVEPLFNLETYDQGGSNEELHAPDIFFKEFCTENESSLNITPFEQESKVEYDDSFVPVDGIGGSNSSRSDSSANNCIYSNRSISNDRKSNIFNNILINKSNSNNREHEKAITPPTKGVSSNHINQSFTNNRNGVQQSYDNKDSFNSIFNNTNTTTTTNNNNQSNMNGNVVNKDTDTKRIIWENHLVCSIYNKQFKSDCTLKGTIKLNPSETPYKCNVCGKHFTRKGSLTRHSRTHTGEKPFACEHCDQRFTEKGTLIKHMKMHTGQKPYQCDICLKRFTWRAGCINHRRVHTGEKPFICVVCKKGFNLRGNLDKHRKVHDGEKPFGCDLCDKRFSEKGTLKRHLRLHSGEKPYKCNVCNRMFSEKGNLKVHEKGHLSAS